MQYLGSEVCQPADLGQPADCMTAGYTYLDKNTLRATIAPVGYKTRNSRLQNFARKQLAPGVCAVHVMLIIPPIYCWLYIQHNQCSCRCLLERRALWSQITRKIHFADTGRRFDHGINRNDTRAKKKCKPTHQTNICNEKEK